MRREGFFFHRLVRRCLSIVPALTCLVGSVCASGGKKGKCENLQGWGLGAGGGAQVGDVKGGDGDGG